MFPLLYRTGTLDYLPEDGVDCPKNIRRNCIIIIFSGFPLNCPLEPKSFKLIVEMRQVEYAGI
jgi:hypothetical protein